MGPWRGSVQAAGWRLEVRLGNEENPPPGVMEGAAVRRPIRWLWRKSWDTIVPKAWESAKTCSWERDGECWEKCGNVSGWKSSCGVDEVDEEDEDEDEKEDEEEVVVVEDAGLWMADTWERRAVWGWDCREEGRCDGEGLALLASLTSLSWALWRQKRTFKTVKSTFDKTPGFKTTTLKTWLLP